MGLRFPLPRFIAVLCQHIKISLSQLAPDSYSFLLDLCVLLRYHILALVPYVLMQLVQVKRLGPGKFYLSHKGDHAFIKGNPSSHKGWMSRFFFVKRVGKKRDPWKCEIRTNGQGRDTGADGGGGRGGLLGHCRNFQEGDEEERASAPIEKEARREKRKKKKEEVPAPEARGAPSSETHRESSSLQELEECPDPTLVINIPEVSPEKEGPTERAVLGRLPPLNFFEDSLVVSSSGVVTTNLLCHIAPDRDIDRLVGASNAEAVGLFSSNLAALEKRLAEMEAALAEETRAVEMHKVALETRGLRLEAERAALLYEKRAIEGEKMALEGEKATMKAELDVTKARAAEEAERMKGKVNPAPFLDAKKALRDMPEDGKEVAEEEDEEEEEEEGDATPQSSPRP
ncbi:hypothetical protein F511_03821 [Dorcoceras hygrometricum]|uniref:Uncharacterized protein n=1 Tax=Dorcoceras hygrometricum TaxID=472368 RepID=A0A2Z7BVZ8_9LAMI|nr:hypothetical protein F511_03821 [Dorcoceras hygrometricum]